MPRRPRRLQPGVPVHITQRGVNRTPSFSCDDDRAFYLELLAALAHDTGSALHAYVLMTNHVHLLLTPNTSGAATLLMMRLGQRYVRAINRAYGRTGTLWEGRFHSSMAQDEAFVLTCYRYIELNPVRAGMVQHPGEYPWSSYRANAGRAPTQMLVPHERYLALGGDDASRRRAYAALVADGLSDKALATIRRATQSNSALEVEEKK